MATSSKKAGPVLSPPATTDDTGTPPAATRAVEVQVVMTCPSPMPVDLIARAPGDTVTTDPDTAARLIASGYAAPTDDQEVS